MNVPVSTQPLTAALQFLKGVGPHRAELLERLGLRTISDLLFFFPRDYQDMSEVCSVEDLRSDEAVSVCGVIEEVELKELGGGRSLLGMLVRQEDLYVRGIWFNQAFLQKQLPLGQRVLLSGTPKNVANRWEFRHPQVTLLNEDETPPRGRIMPIYSLTQGINQRQMRKLVGEAVQSHRGQLEDVFDEDYLDSHRLLPIQEALSAIHSPGDLEALSAARRRFVYQEFLVLQLALALQRARLSSRREAPQLETTARIDARIRRLFPFPLTSAQEQAIAEIRADMAADVPMNRLLQGDVGSGKTVVAEYAMLLAVAHGFQAVMMAPTEVLARQHVRTLGRDLRDSQVRIALLTGTLTAAQRRKVLAEIAAGEADLVVGTHAVVQENVEFHRLGLVVIDEQQKFGVRQRAQLREASFDPHYLVMTATPIPRTVAMTLYGDLDTSRLNEMPPGRQPVHSYFGNESQRESWWEFFRKKLREGRQGYVVTPLVEESEQMDLASVTQTYEELVHGPLEDFRLDLIHGRLPAVEKEAAMRAFREGRTQVLVATSVVEVGVDVANATLMTIESGERFGLSQLHQLRGRIGRGTHPGYLCVFGRTESAEARQRLEAFVATGDGFELAERDFQLRGPGDLLGTRQHGLPPLRIADLGRDQPLLEEARRDAQQLIQDDPQLRSPRWSRIRRMVWRRYGESLQLGDVG